MTDPARVAQTDDMHLSLTLIVAVFPPRRGLRARRDRRAGRAPTTRTMLVAAV